MDQRERDYYDAFAPKRATISRAAAQEEISRCHSERAGQMVSDKTTLADEAAPLSALQEIIGQVQTAAARVYQSTERLQEIGDRVMGTLPRSSCDEDAQRSPDGTLEWTFMCLNNLCAQIDNLDSAITRIERI
jgi:hypothetical protein